jgi:hypothetical protein
MKLNRVVSANKAIPTVRGSIVVLIRKMPSMIIHGMKRVVTESAGTIAERNRKKA